MTAGDILDSIRKNLGSPWNENTYRYGTFCERGAFHQFEDEGSVFDTVDRRDIGVVQRGQDLGFAGETREAIGISGEDIRKDFDGDFAIELGIRGAVDGAHAALAEF